MSLEKIKKQFITSKTNKYYYYRVIINYCLGAASLITRVRLVSPSGGITGGSGNLSTSLSNVATLAAHPKFVWVFNANCDGTIIYNDPVLILLFISCFILVCIIFSFICIL
jgi:hypothetical protein